VATDKQIDIGNQTGLLTEHLGAWMPVPTNEKGIQSALAGLCARDQHYNLTNGSMNKSKLRAKDSQWLASFNVTSDLRPRALQLTGAGSVVD
jgi:hypothetical protein